MHGWETACSSLSLAPGCCRQEAFLISCTALRLQRHKLRLWLQFSKGLHVFRFRLYNNPGERLPSLSGTGSFPGSQPCSFCSPLCATSRVNSLLSHAPVAWFGYIHKTYSTICLLRGLAYRRLIDMRWAPAHPGSWNALPAFHSGPLTCQL